MDTEYEVIVINLDTANEAAKVLTSAFQKDAFSKWLFWHLDPKASERTRMMLNVHQLKYFLQNGDKFIVAGLRDLQTGKLASVAIWELPEHSQLGRTISQSIGPTKEDVFNHFKTNWKAFWAQQRFGSLGKRKFRRSKAAVKYVQDTLCLPRDSIYKLYMLGTRPEFRGRGYASAMVGFIIDHIEKDYLDHVKPRAIQEKIINCDYSSPETALDKPALALEASVARNCRFYSKFFGFQVFALIYYRDPDIDAMIKSWLEKDWNERGDDVEYINEKPYFFVRFMIANRKCDEEKNFFPGLG